MSKLSLFHIVVVLAFGLAVTHPVAAADPPAPAPEARPQALVVDVTGFRSAHFGMTEAEVRAAINTDFGVKAAAIRAEDQPVDKTRVLTIKVPDVIPQGGVAEISYVLGFKSHKLIQIMLTWSKAIDESLKPETLIGDAQLLTTYFQERGYKPDSIAMNTPVAGGIIMFRGKDAHDRTTLLLLRGTTAEVKDQRVFTPSSLSSLYIEDAQHPDVYRLTPGQF
jgi:hypothetical protein